MRKKHVCLIVSILLAAVMFLLIGCANQDSETALTNEFVVGTWQCHNNHVRLIFEIMEETDMTTGSTQEMRIVRSLINSETDPTFESGWAGVSLGFWSIDNGLLTTNHLLVPGIQPNPQFKRDGSNLVSTDIGVMILRKI